MNPEAQNIAIAEACGWEQLDHKWRWKAPNGVIHENWGGYLPCPDYVNDLNAIHKAEAVMLKEGLQDHWLDILVEVVVGENVHWSDYHCFPQVNRATSIQRAEALLKTLNLWES